MDMEGLRRIADGPLGSSLRGATYGALLGWLYDKSKEEKEKKNSYHGMSIGAVLGALGGAGYGQFRSDRSHAFDVQELKRKINALSENKAEGAEKNAQAGEMWMMPSDTQRAWARELSKKPPVDHENWDGFSSSAISRAMSKGLHEAIPGLADIAGSVAGVLNGTGRGIGNWVSGGPETFGEAFSKGFDDSADFARKYYSDPIRYAQMYYGGDKVKKELDEMNDFYRRRILESKGPPADKYGHRNQEYWAAVDKLNKIKSFSRGVGTATELAIQWPMLGGVFGKIFGPLGKLTSRIKGAPSVANAMSKVEPVVGAMGKSMPTLARVTPKVERVLSSITSSPYAVSPAWGALDARDEYRRRQGEYDLVTEGLDGYAKSWDRIHNMFDKKIIPETDVRKQDELMMRAKGIADAAEDRRRKNMNSWGQFIRR